MINILVNDQLQLLAFWLCFTRWVTVLFQLPLFDQTGIPSMVKVLISMMVALAFFKSLAPAILLDLQVVGHRNWWLLGIYQAVVGLLIGFLVRVIMSLYASTGTIISQQIGFSAIQYFDQNSGQYVGPIEKLLNWTLVVLIVTSGALQPMFSGVFESFSTISLSNMSKVATMPAYFSQLFTTLFKAAILLASPILVANVFITCMMGITARVVPQVNILMMSFIINIGMGLLVLIIIFDEFFVVAYQYYLNQLGQWLHYLR